MTRQRARTADGPRIRRLAASERVEFLFTCDAQLRKHQIYRQDAVAALCSCSVIKSEHVGNQWRRTIKGFDRDSDEIFLVVTVECDSRRIEILDGWR